MASPTKSSSPRPAGGASSAGKAGAVRPGAGLPSTPTSFSSRGGRSHRRPSDGTHTRAARRAESQERNLGDGKELSARTKGHLSQVPCKFYRQGHCAAGDACHFRHDTSNLSDEDEDEVVKNPCSWFQKGQCKFGNKCMLPHVLPGEPRSADRRARVRKPPTHAIHEPLGYDSTMNPQSTDYSSVDAYFMQGYSYNGMDAPRQFAPAPAPPPASLLGAPPFPPSPSKRSWSDVLARGRDQDDLSPVRRAHIVGPAHSSSPPLPSPLALPEGISPQYATQQANGASVFGTSPFSAPGSRSIFLGASSYDSTADADGFARRIGTPPVSSSHMAAQGSWPPAMDGVADDEDDLEDMNEEDAVPSSLSELLTDAEIERRRERHSMQKHSLPADARYLSRSVPSTFLDGPSLASTSVSLAAQHAKATAAAAMLGSSPRALGSTPPHSLSHQPSAPVALPPFIQRANAYLASTGGANGGGGPGSLPPGLAAGLSRLHFQPAGNTPPSVQPSPNFGPTSPSNNPAPSGFNLRPPLASGGGSGSGMSRRLSGHNASALVGGMVVGSPLAKSWLGDGEERVDAPRVAARPSLTGRVTSYAAEEDVPFDMDDVAG